LRQRRKRHEVSRLRHDRQPVFDIALPALREHTSDVPLLADHFLTEFSESIGYRHCSR
jgi:DNA-binding NtrC family response regulator